MNLSDYIHAVPDFPQPGVIFRDIMPLFADPDAFQHMIHQLKQACQDNQLLPDYIVGIESRGFIIGAPLAYAVSAGFIPVRKTGKLPGDVYETDYVTEYSQERLAIQQCAIKVPNAKVLVVDDVIANGGTACATLDLLAKVDCDVTGFLCLIELLALNGREKLPRDLPVISLIQY